MYKEFAVDLSHAQAVKVLHGKPVRLCPSQLNKGHSHYFHPENYKKLVKAYEAGKGITYGPRRSSTTHQSGLIVGLELRKVLALLGTFSKQIGSQSLPDFWMVLLPRPDLKLLHCVV